MRFKKIVLRYTLIVILLSTQLAVAQNDGTSPQFWNNLGLGIGINDHWSQNNILSYNFLADVEYTWQEVTYWGNLEYSLYPTMEVMGGLYLASTEQGLGFRTNEVRPFLGVRIHSSVDKRFSIANLSRFEFRFMFNKEDGWNPSQRFRNRTTAAVAINKPALSASGMLSLFGYFEIFSNSEQVEERFFVQLKYKFGMAYRLSDNWRFNIGTIFQQSENTLKVPSTLPTGIVTNVVLESGVIYRINR